MDLWENLPVVGTTRTGRSILLENEVLPSYSDRVSTPMKRCTIATLAAISLAGMVSAPVWAADPVGFTILDAVRSTVALNPLIKAAGQDVEISKARKQQATGAFGGMSPQISNSADGAANTPIRFTLG